jgi:beta-fructofuranosidase
MMYAPRGFGLSEVGDVEVFPAGEQLHLFHLTLPNHDVVRHAVSDDGLAWRELPNALYTGDPGSCDDDMIWTMSVTERQGTYYMVYTALARAEDGQVQRTALATSRDLVHWTKSSRNPVGEADPRWYEADQSASGRVSWRDPKPILVGDTYYAAVCARENSGPLLRRGCVGVLTSEDLENWEAGAPLFAPRRYWDLECPQVFEIGGTYYITAAIMEDRTQRYWSAPAFAGPYQIPSDGGLLAPRGHYAGRVCRWRGMDLYYCWHIADYDWTGFRNPFGKFVVPPLVLTPRPDGSLGLRSFPGLETYQQATPAPPTLMANTLYRSKGAPNTGVVRIDTPDGMDILATDRDAEDFWLEGTLHLDAAAGGLAFRLDEQGGGYFVELTTGTAEVSLRKWLPAPSAGDQRQPWFRQVELQRGRLLRPVQRGASVQFRLIVVGPYVECSLDGEVVLATLSAERTVGRVGFWAESGAASVSSLGLTSMRPPVHS